MNDPWQTLCIMPTRDLGKIKAAYRTRAQRFHPDKARTPEGKACCTLQFIELQEAYMDAKFRAQYEPDLQPLHIRRPPDLSKNALLSNAWFMAMVAAAAGLFGFWLLWVNAPYYATHDALSLTHSIVVAGLTRIPTLAWVGRAVGCLLRITPCNGRLRAMFHLD